ncbi:MAG TPA: type II toxin-antitoxin system HicB family antitoxin [Bradyrhizobium sp.]
MMTMRYKDYEAMVEYDEEAEIFHGEVADLRDVITFQAKSVAALKKAFADSIEDYLAFCKARGEEPEAELKSLAALPDSAIDTSDAPEVLEWSGAKRGSSTGPSSNN